MMKLSAITYPALWLAIIALAVLGQWRWMLPAATLIIGLHFTPLTRIFNRKIDCAIAPITVGFAVAGMVLAANPHISWRMVYAIAGTGGALASGIYGAYLVCGYGGLRKQLG